MAQKIKSASIISAAFAVLLSIRIGFIINDGNITKAAAGRGSYTVRSASAGGMIYDRTMTGLVNQGVKLEAVVNPNDQSALIVFPYVADYDRFYSGVRGNLPFLCEITSDEPESYGVTVFRNAARYSENQPAQHIIGYTSDNVGVTGIERAFDELLRGSVAVSTARYSVNAVGGVLNGLGADIVRVPESPAGVVTTIDSQIQEVAETALRNSGYSKGAVVIMDVFSGDILACVSSPGFSAADVGSYLDSQDANFINRAFSAYSVGSVFKLVTVAAALEIGISPEYIHNCGGYIHIGDVTFNCHKWGGHGELNMQGAIAESCNTYFIEISEFIGRDVFVETASALGFGESTELCFGMNTAAGYLQTPLDISIPAERANMSFGQGKLTATPLQVCRMTAAIANGGILPEPKLIKGTVDDSWLYTAMDSESAKRRALSVETAEILKEFMVNTVMREASLSRPYYTKAAGKTSTAQTGVMKEDGSEVMNCWFTGYFPTVNPQYAVTVFIEDGYSGNISASPVFREIADGVTNLN